MIIGIHDNGNQHGKVDKLAVKKNIARQVIRTVPYNSTKSKEGLLLDGDGSIIYDDAWMHRDVLDDEQK